MKTINPQIPGPQGNPKCKPYEENLPRLSIIKLLGTDDEKKMLKAARGKRGHITHRGTKMQMAPDFLSESI